MVKAKFRHKLNIKMIELELEWGEEKYCLLFVFVVQNKNLVDIITWHVCGF